jgi:hypothetical protein
MNQVLDEGNKVFIQKKLQHGASEAEIKLLLLQNGWRTPEINQLFSEYRMAVPLHQPQQQSWVMPVSILVASVFILSVLFFSFGNASSTGLVVASPPKNTAYLSAFYILIAANIIFMLMAIIFIILTTQMDRK